MYRIELAPGEETVFRTIEELAIGLRNGLVTSRSRIYHQATQKWLPIEFHPHYKKALDLSSHRHDLPAAKVPDRLDTLSFAVPRAPASVETTPAEWEPKLPSPEPVVTKSRATHSVEPVHAEPARGEPTRVEPAPVEPAPATPKPLRSNGIASSATAFNATAPVTAPAPKVELVFAAPVEHTAVVRTRVEFPALAALAEVEPAAERSPLPAPVPSPVLQFPAIVYPEITPADPPVAEPVTEASRSGRAYHLAGAIVVLALGGYGMMSLAPSRGAAGVVPAVADRPVQAEPESPEPALPALAGEPAEPPLPPAATKPVTMTQPASSGFAPALEARAIVAPSAAVTPATVAPAPTKDSSLVPAPLDLQLDVPALDGAESLMTTPRSDSAMKRILRAVNGGKDVPPAR